MHWLSLRDKSAFDQIEIGDFLVIGKDYERMKVVAEKRKGMLGLVPHNTPKP